MAHSGHQLSQVRSAPRQLVISAAATLALVSTAPSMRAQASVADSGAGAITVSLSYTGEVVGDAAGGTRRGTTALGVAGAQLTLSLRRLVDWPHARAFLFVIGTHGGAPSDLVGDVQGVSNIQAPAGVRLEEAWLQQNLAGDRLSLLVGRYDLSTEFYRLQSGALFINSSFGFGPELAQSGVAGPSIFPKTSVGGRVELKPSPNVVWRTAVLNGAPVGGGGGIRLFAAPVGALFVSEVALLSRPDTAGMPMHPRFQIGRGVTRPFFGKIAVGGWYYTARFSDLVDTLSTGAPVRHRGSRGLYLIGDQTVWAAGRGRPGVLTAFIQLGVGDGRVNQVGGYVGGGVTRTAPFAGRAQDELGLGVATALSGSHYQRAQLSASSRATDAETAIELTYLTQLGSWLAVQPDVQYVIHPGNAQATRSAIVPGLRIALSR